MKNSMRYWIVSVFLLSITGGAFAAPEKPAGESLENLSDYGKPTGLFGAFTLGPAMSLLSIPRPLYIGLEGKYANLIGFQIGEGFIPDLMFQDATINIQSLSAGVKWFPFRGAFFIGMDFGTQKITAKKSAVISTSIPTPVSASVDATMEVTSSFYTPKAGWRWVWETGFFMGFDVGWQIASGAETDFRSNLRVPVLLVTSEYGQLETDVKKVGNDIGNKPLPALTLLHFGWLF